MYLRGCCEQEEDKKHSARLFKFILFLSPMAKKRKNRTHLKGPNNTPSEDDGAPKSFIIKHGQVGPSLTQLVRDVRKVMEPNTASRLKVKLTAIFDTLDGLIYIWYRKEPETSSKIILCLPQLFELHICLPLP